MIRVIDTIYLLTYDLCIAGLNQVWEKIDFNSHFRSERLYLI